jgi:uncharacterized membrane protein YraQ (UPF0718 family)
MNLIAQIVIASWDLLLEASVFVVFGLLISGLLKVFLDPGMVARHLGRGRFASVFKAAILGIPIPLCSCGVLPAALSLKKQGANNGATTAFMISTPESGVDSIAITYALMDPIMTMARPIAAFCTAAVAGISENLLGYKKAARLQAPDRKCPVDGCCDGVDCPSEIHSHHHSIWQKIGAGIRYAFTDFWGDLAAWFLFGILLAGVITTLIPDDIFTRYLGSGLPAMLLMLVVGIPLYICATASTPIAAALILKGVSPGAALVFLLAGPATNIASLTVLVGILGKRAAALYLSAIAICAVVFGLLLDMVYAALGISAAAVVGQASEVMPLWVEWSALVFLLAISIKPVGATLRAKFRKLKPCDPATSRPTADCGAT